MKQIPNRTAAVSNPRQGYLGLILAGAVLTLLALTGCQPQEPALETAPTESAPAGATASPEPTIELATETPIPTSTPVPTPTFDIRVVEDWGSGMLVLI